MAREKSKRKRTSKDFTTKILRDINSTKLTGSELMEFANEVQRLKPKDRDFEGRTIAAIRFFEGDSDRVMSAIFRMEALARIISQGRLEGWTKPSEKKGMFLTNTALFDAAGQIPLRIIKNRFEFSRATLLKKVFQIAKFQKK
ncbi:MAG: hypothetical protein ABSH06_10370 [Thermodesulfobacteriota bacterium]